MDNSDKGIRRRRIVHDIPADVDETSLEAIAGSFPAPCPKCGSSDTRRSRKKVAGLVLYLKGNLHRCRNCKRHFRVRGDSTRAFIVVGAPAALLIGLLVFMLMDSVRDQVISAVDSIHVSLLSFTKARPETSPLDGPTGPEADALAERVRGLYSDATSVDRQIPLVNSAYRDAPALYKSRLEQEKQRSGKAIAKTPGGEKPTAMQVEERLERQHQKVTTTESDFRNNLASVMAGVEKIAKACSKLHAARNPAGPQLKACDDFDRTVSALRVQVDIALDRLKSAEQEYQKARQAINEINGANRSTPSPAPVQAKE